MIKIYNIKKELTTQYARINSFDAISFKSYSQDKGTMLLEINNNKNTFIVSVEYEKVNNNYNKDISPKRIYFICPVCHKRVQYLYYKSGLKCRTCAELIYPTQTYNRGYSVYYVKVERLMKKLKFTDYLCIEDMMHAIPDKPKYMRLVTYDNLIDNLIDLQQEWSEKFYKDIYIRLDSVIKR